MPHILIFDDDPLICQMLRLGLEQQGYEVRDAQDGRKGLALHEAAPADLVITDLVMPGMEGIETILELKRHYPATKIIAMSGGGVGKGTDYLSMAKKFGAHRIISKPFTMQQILQVVAEAFGEPPAPAAGGPAPS